MEKKIEERNRLKMIVEAIDFKLTKEGYVFTPRHFDVTMDALIHFNLVSKEEHDKLKQQADEMRDMLKSDSVYWLLRFGYKNPEAAGLDDIKDNYHCDLYNLSNELRIQTLTNYENKVR